MLLLCSRKLADEYVLTRLPLASAAGRRTEDSQLNGFLFAPVCVLCVRSLHFGCNSLWCSKDIAQLLNTFGLTNVKYLNKLGKMRNDVSCGRNDYQ